MRNAPQNPLILHKLRSFLPMKCPTSGLLSMTQCRMMLSKVKGSSSYSSKIDTSVSLIFFSTHQRAHLDDGLTVLCVPRHSLWSSPWNSPSTGPKSANLPSQPLRAHLCPPFSSTADRFCFKLLTTWAVSEFAALPREHATPLPLQILPEAPTPVCSISTPHSCETSKYFILLYISSNATSYAYCAQWYRPCWREMAGEICPLCVRCLLVC